MTTLYDLYSDKQPQTRCPNCRTDAHEIGQEQPKLVWVPVTDHLPQHENFVAVIVCDELDIAYYRMGGEWHNSENRWLGSGAVTHWYELPELPEAVP